MGAEANGPMSQLETQPEASTGLPWDFIPAEALPPETNVTPAINTLAGTLRRRLDLPDTDSTILTVLRLGAPYGNVTGLALNLPGYSRAWVCLLAEFFAHRAGRSSASPGLRRLSDELRADVLLGDFPTLKHPPRRNANILWDVHSQLATTPAYALLAGDLYLGLTAAVARTGWSNHPRAIKSLDAMVTSVLRLVPRLDAARLQAALAEFDEEACAQIVREAALCLPYESHPNRLLPVATQLGYLRDCCRLLNHPRWAEASISSAPLGFGVATVTSTRRDWMDDDDDPPEFDAAPDRFRERHLRALEKKVRVDLAPGSSLDDLAAEVEKGHGRFFYGEELAVMREYPNLIAWHTAHLNDLLALLRWIFDERARSATSQALRTLLLTLCLTGRSSEWLTKVELGEWPAADAFGPQSPPRYVPECAAIVYWPDAIPALPTEPQHAADLFEVVSSYCVLPLPELLIPRWQALAQGRATGERLLPLTASQVNEALRAATQLLRRNMPNRPALTVGRLRSAFTALMESEAGLDPILAAFISEQWRPSLRVPLFYTTVTAEQLAGRYRAATARVWEILRKTDPRLPAPPMLALPPLPDIRMGSPYLPKLDVVRAAIQSLHQAIVMARNDEARHNALTMLALYGLSILCGLRISEAAHLSVAQFDLDVVYGGLPLPWLMLPETKGSRWTTAARIVPLPKVLLPLLRQLLPANRQALAFSLIQRGRHVHADQDQIRRELATYQVPFPRWHAGRHLVRTVAVNAGVPFAVINAVLGHQSAGCELLNPYLPGNLLETWRCYLDFADRLAELVGWPTTLP
jgi:integrase